MITVWAQLWATYDIQCAHFRVQDLFVVPLFTYLHDKELSKLKNRYPIFDGNIRPISLPESLYIQIFGNLLEA